MNASEESIELIKRWEAFRATAYDDGLGNLTIGYGFTDLMPGFRSEWLDQRMSKSEADAILRDVLEEHYASILREYLNDSSVALSDHAFGALCSLAWNVDPHLILKSELMGHIVDGHFREAADAFLDWIYVHVDGEPEIWKGLVKRRVAERDLFLLRPHDSRTVRAEPVPTCEPIPPNTKSFNALKDYVPPTL